MFCWKCLHRWLELQLLCPTCRHRLKVTDDVWPIYSLGQHSGNDLRRYNFRNIKQFKHSISFHWLASCFNNDFPQLVSNHQSDDQSLGTLVLHSVSIGLICAVITISWLMWSILLNPEYPINNFKGSIMAGTFAAAVVARKFNLLLALMCFTGSFVLFIY